MSGPYFDTGVALKLVVEEPLSPLVREFVVERRVAVPFPTLLELEMENALQALFFRKHISEPQLAKARGLVRSLIREGRFARPGLSLDRIAKRTLQLAPTVTSATGCWTLDLMHIAAAELLGAKEFVSTDKRQGDAARLRGLRVVTLGSGEPPDR